VLESPVAGDLGYLRACELERDSDVVGCYLKHGCAYSLRCLKRAASLQLILVADAHAALFRCLALGFTPADEGPAKQERTALMNGTSAARSLR